MGANDRLLGSGAQDISNPYAFNSRDAGKAKTGLLMSPYNSAYNSEMRGDYYDSSDNMRWVICLTHRFSEQDIALMSMRAIADAYIGYQINLVLIFAGLDS